MSEHFIKNIEIKHFKCFENFKAEGFGRVNLIGGKNNVGKTAFMEACYIEKQHTSKALFDIIFSRYKMNFLDEFLQEIGVKYIFNFIKGRAKDITGGTISSGKNKKDIIYDENNLNEEFNNIVFLDTSLQSNSDYNKWYASIIEKNFENHLDNLIQRFDNNIEAFRIIESKPKCRKTTNGIYYNLNEFGDGLGKFISFICLLQTNKDGYIFIDEIENGIHYSKLKDIWKAIIEIVQKEGKQLFVTTHDKESIEALIEASEELNYQDISSIQLYKDDTNTIVPIVLQYDNFAYGINRGADVR